MKPRHVMMVAALAVAGWLALFGDKSPASGGSAGQGEAVQPVVRAEANAPASGEERMRAPENASGIEIAPLIPRQDLVGEGAERDLFAATSWKPPTRIEVPPPPPPRAPALPFTYLGRRLAAGRLEIYLARGDEVLIVGEHALIDRTYRVETVTPTTMSLTYLPLNELQTLALGIAN